MASKVLAGSILDKHQGQVGVGIPHLVLLEVCRQRLELCLTCLPSRQAAVHAGSQDTGRH